MNGVSTKKYQIKSCAWSGHSILSSIIVLIGVNLEWKNWGKVRETTFRELTPTSRRVRTKASKTPYISINLLIL